MIFPISNGSILLLVLCNQWVHWFITLVSHYYRFNVTNKIVKKNSVKIFLFLQMTVIVKLSTYMYETARKWCYKRVKKIPWYVEQWNKDLKLIIERNHYKKWRMIKYKVGKTYIFMCPSEISVYVFSTMTLQLLSVQLHRRCLF